MPQLNLRGKVVGTLIAALEVVVIVLLVVPSGEGSTGSMNPRPLRFTVWDALGLGSLALASIGVIGSAAWLWPRIRSVA
jgi:hypothetical protein